MKTKIKRTLSEWLTWQEQSHPKTWDLGLQRIGEVWQRLNPNNEKIAPHIITVAGTNGKGSCVRWAEEICCTHGISVATFSSPHLRDYRERIRFHGKNVSAEDLISAFEVIDKAREEITLTYFEWSALAMFYLCLQKEIEIVVLEVGLGGRLDATNLIDADATIITRIGLDHQDWLGHDRETIALEKAGIMRKNQRVFITDDNPPETLANYAAHIGAIVSWFGRDFMAKEKRGILKITLPVMNKPLLLPLPRFMTGKHQFAHLAAIIYALSPWFTIQEDLLTEVVNHAKNEGRLMLVDGNPNILLDVAHNPDSAEVLAEYLYAFKKQDKKIIAICGMLKDKDQERIFQIISPIIDWWILIPLGGARGSSVDFLQKNAQRAHINHHSMSACADIKDALSTARQKAQPSDTIVIFGSFVTVSAALEELSL